VIAVIKSTSSVLRTAVHATLGVISMPVQVGSARNAWEALRAIRERTSPPASVSESLPPITAVRAPLGKHAALTGNRRSVITIDLPASDSPISGSGC
jgi:hypothetical protein